MNRLQTTKLKRFKRFRLRDKTDISCTHVIFGPSRNFENGCS